MSAENSTPSSSSSLSSSSSSSSDSKREQKSSLKEKINYCKEQLRRQYLHALNAQQQFGPKTTECLIDYYLHVKDNEIMPALKQALGARLIALKGAEPSPEQLDQISAEIFAQRHAQDQTELGQTFQSLIVKKFIFQHAAANLRQYIQDPQELAGFLQSALLVRTLPGFSPEPHRKVLDKDDDPSYLNLAKLIAQEALNIYRRVNRLPIQKLPKAEFKPLPKLAYSKSIHQKGEEILKGVLFEDASKGLKHILLTGHEMGNAIDPDPAAIKKFLDQFAQKGTCFKLLAADIDVALKHGLIFDESSYLHTLALQMRDYAKQKENLDDNLAKFLLSNKGQTKLSDEQLASLNSNSSASIDLTSRPLSSASSSSRATDSKAEPAKAPQPAADPLAALPSKFDIDGFEIDLDFTKPINGRLTNAAKQQKIDQHQIASDIQHGLKIGPDKLAKSSIKLAADAKTQKDAAGIEKILQCLIKRQAEMRELGKTDALHVLGLSYFHYRLGLLYQDREQLPAALAQFTSAIKEIDAVMPKTASPLTTQLEAIKAIIENQKSGLETTLQKIEQEKSRKAAAEKAKQIAEEKVQQALLENAAQTKSIDKQEAKTSKDNIVDDADTDALIISTPRGVIVSSASTGKKTFTGGARHRLEAEEPAAKPITQSLYTYAEDLPPSSSSSSTSDSNVKSKSKTDSPAETTRSSSSANSSTLSTALPAAAVSSSSAPISTDASAAKAKLVEKIALLSAVALEIPRSASPEDQTRFQSSITFVIGLLSKEIRQFEDASNKFIGPSSSGPSLEDLAQQIDSGDEEPRKSASPVENDQPAEPSKPEEVKLTSTPASTVIQPKPAPQPVNQSSSSSSAALSFAQMVAQTRLPDPNSPEIAEQSKAAQSKWVLLAERLKFAPKKTAVQAKSAAASAMEFTLGNLSIDLTIDPTRSYRVIKRGDNPVGLQGIDALAHRALLAAYTDRRKIYPDKVAAFHEKVIKPLEERAKLINPKQADALHIFGLAYFYFQISRLHHANGFPIKAKEAADKALDYLNQQITGLDEADPRWQQLWDAIDVIERSSPPEPTAVATRDIKSSSSSVDPPVPSKWVQFAANIKPTKPATSTSAPTSSSAASNQQKPAPAPKSENKSPPAASPQEKTWAQRFADTSQKSPPAASQTRPLKSALKADNISSSSSLSASNSSGQAPKKQVSFQSSSQYETEPSELSSTSSWVQLAKNLNTSPILPKERKVHQPTMLGKIPTYFALEGLAIDLDLKKSIDVRMIPSATPTRNQVPRQLDQNQLAIQALESARTIQDSDDYQGQVEVFATTITLLQQRAELMNPQQADTLHILGLPYFYYRLSRLHLANQQLREATLTTNKAISYLAKQREGLNAADPRRQQLDDMMGFIINPSRQNRSSLVPQDFPPAVIYYDRDDITFNQGDWALEENDDEDLPSNQFRGFERV